MILLVFPVFVLIKNRVLHFWQVLINEVLLEIASFSLFFWLTAILPFKILMLFHESYEESSAVLIVRQYAH